MRSIRRLLLVFAGVVAFATPAAAQNYTPRQLLNGPSSSYFGLAVDMDGDIFVVGARDERVGSNDKQGAVYVYRLNGTTWTRQQRLTAADGRFFDGFGSAVAVSGNTIAIGAEHGSGPSAAPTGSVYIFVWNGVSWVQQAELVGDAVMNGDFLGQQVDIDGDFVIAGAPGYRTTNATLRETGAAYVFERIGTTWTRYPLVSGQLRQRYGWSVAISGNVACVGNLAEGLSTVGDGGAAYIFERTAGWTLRQRVVADGRGASDEFSKSCAVNGDTVVVGAPGQDAAYVFARNGVTWQKQQVLLPVGVGDGFGSAVEIEGATAVVGASNIQYQGSAFVFDRSGSTWTQRQRLQPNTGSGRDGIGLAIASNPQWLFLGAFELDDVAVYGIGAVTGQAPGQARNFAASAVGSTVSMSWQPPSSGGAATNYVLRARTTGGALILTAPLGLTTTFAAPAPDGVYVLTIQAANAHGAGPESAAATVTVSTVAPPPGPPTNLVTSTTGTTLMFSWGAPTSGGAPTSYVLLAGLTPGFSVPFATVPLPANPRSLAVPGVPPGTYYVRVVAQNSGGISAASNEVAAVVAGASLPAAPSLSASVVGPGTVQLSWTSGSGGAPSGYTLYASLTPSGAPIVTAPLAGTSLVIPGVPSGTYYLRLTARNAAGTSPPSAPVTLVVP